MQNKKIVITVISLALVLIVADFLFFNSAKNVALKYFILVLILVIASLPFLISFLINSGKQKEKETRFLEFVRDLVEGVKVGTPINKAISNLKARDYGALTPHIQKLINQTSLGISLSIALNTFARDTQSKVVSRSVSLISEAERSGGQIEDILNSVAESVNKIENLRKEQKASVYNLIVQGYIIFFVFIIIILVLEYYILPLTQGIGGISDLNVGTGADSSADLQKPLFGLLIVQSFFAGLVIGKVSEGKLKDGVKHAFILIAVTLLIFSGAGFLLGV